MKTKIPNITVLALLVLLIGACAQKEIVVGEEGLKPLNSLNEPMVKVDGDPQLSVGQVEDNRPQTDSLGTAHSGMFDQEVQLKTQQPVADFVRSRFVKGLSERGFLINNEAQYSLKMRIRKLWVSEIAPGKDVEKANCDLEIEYDVVDRASNRARVTGTVVSQSSGTNSILGATKSVGPAVESCIAIAMNYMIQQKNFANLLGLRVRAVDQPTGRATE